MIMLIGSLAFGLEAMLLGLGGKLMVLYRRRRAKTLAVALVVGLAIAGPATATSMVLSLEPLYFCALVLVYLFIAGGLINLLGAKRVRTPPPPLPPPSEEEMEVIIRKRGYGGLLRKKRKSRTV